MTFSEPQPPPLYNADENASPQDPREQSVIQMSKPIALCLLPDRECLYEFRTLVTAFNFVVGGGRKKKGEVKGAVRSPL